jgi:hypothetical protein
MMMAALEGQNDGFDAMTRALSRSTSRADERSSGWNEKAA